MGLYRGDLQHDLGNNYICFIKDYFPPDYKQVDSQLKSRASSKNDLYRIVRCGLVH